MFSIDLILTRRGLNPATTMKGFFMFPVYYFEKLPETLPDDKICYIISKYIYLKKRVGLVDSLVQVDSIDMGVTIPEYAKMNLPKIKAKVFGQVLGFFRMIYKEYRTEAGTILNLKTHPQNPKLKKVDFTVPHQRVSSGSCKYEIVIDPTYINCGTIHSHANFSAFHSGTDINDERYFDGLHITVGHVDQNKFSVSACVVVNGKRVKVNPSKYIEGLIKITEDDNSYFSGDHLDYFSVEDDSLVIEDKKYLNRVTPLYRSYRPIQMTAKDKQKQIEFEWAKPRGVTDLFNQFGSLEEEVAPCQSCVFKEVRLDMLYDEIDLEESDIFSESDKNLMEKSQDNFFNEYIETFGESHMREDSAPLFKEGDQDEDGIVRRNNKITTAEYNMYEKQALKRHVKCSCGTTYFVPNPREDSICPSCEIENKGKTFTMEDAIKMHQETARL